VYTLGVDEGTREENHAVGSGGGTNNSGSAESKQPQDPNAHYHSIQGALTPTLLESTRKASKELVQLLHNYHGGEQKAKDMLMRSWQAAWELDVELFMDQHHVNDNDDDDNNNSNDDDGNNRKLGKKKKGKIVKPLNDPQDMNDEEKERHHQSKRERVTKLITTMARALLNPNQGKFMIGTIGRLVSR
jgi:hypothetical protein